MNSTFNKEPLSHVELVDLIDDLRPRCQRLMLFWWSRALVKSAMEVAVEIVKENAEINDNDGWDRCEPFIDWEAANAVLFCEHGVGHG